MSGTGRESGWEYGIIEAPVVSEKSTVASEQGRFSFRVKREAGKAQIKAALERLFKVEVERVNVMWVKGKRKKFRGVSGRRASWKKATVRLKEGSSIDVGTGV